MPNLQLSQNAKPTAVTKCHSYSYSQTTTRAMTAADGRSQNGNNDQDQAYHKMATMTRTRLLYDVIRQWDNEMHDGDDDDERPIPYYLDDDS